MVGSDFSAQTATGMAPKKVGVDCRGSVKKGNDNQRKLEDVSHRETNHQRYHPDFQPGGICCPGRQERFFADFR